MALEMRIKEAIEELAEHLDIDRDVAEKLARAGIVTPDGLMAVEQADLVGIGLTPETAAELVARAATYEPQVDEEEAAGTEEEDGNEDGGESETGDAPAPEAAPPRQAGEEDENPTSA
jgi:hypothetical protein